MSFPKFVARDFARELGLAFQITDDVLEAEDENECSDEKNGKVTYVSLFGVEKAKELAAIHTKNALAALNHFGDAADEIRLIAESLLSAISVICLFCLKVQYALARLVERPTRPLSW